jgi:2-polyprenyl-3-methyl-5-hydroxy-6-metoxy-1,4-benzoquinol methylase
MVFLMTVIDRLLAKLPIVGTKIQGLRKTLTTIQLEVSRLGTQMQVLRSQLADQSVALATLAHDRRRIGTALDPLPVRAAVDPVVAELVDCDKSPKARLMSDGDSKSHLEALRRHLATDTSAAVKAGLESPAASKAFGHDWWQRLAIPGTNCFTTSDHGRLKISDPGLLNTLGNKLTPEEGFLLRPMPKWAYLEPIFPVLAGKTILEIGCNNGFFCFEFQQLGAAQVTGAEVYEGFINPARWMAAARGTQNIEFLLTDALLDFGLPAHDVVFMSEVYGHFVDPLFGILRAINLAKQTLIIDSAALTSSNYEISLRPGVHPTTGKMQYHTWILSDGLMLAYLLLCGVPPEKVTRYFAPWPNHIVYVIDTRDVANYRKANDFQPCNTSFIKMQRRM